MLEEQVCEEAFSFVWFFFASTRAGFDFVLDTLGFVGVESGALFRKFNPRGLV